MNWSKIAGITGITLIAVVILSVGMYFYIMFNGKPWEEAEFKKETKEYLTQKHPDLLIKDVSVNYQFKEMEYYSVIETQSAVLFKVRRLNNGQLDDDYYTSIWKSKVSRIATEYVKEKFNPKANAYFEILANDEVMKQYSNYDSFSQFSDKLEYSTKLLITLNENFKEDESYQKSFDTIEWIINEQKFQTNIVFRFNDRNYIYIGEEDLTSISDWKSLSKFLKQSSS